MIAMIIMELAEEETHVKAFSMHHESSAVKKGDEATLPFPEAVKARCANE